MKGELRQFASWTVVPTVVDGTDREISTSDSSLDFGQILFHERGNIPQYPSARAFSCNRVRSCRLLHCVYHYNHDTYNGCNLYSLYSIVLYPWILYIYILKYIVTLLNPCYPPDSAIMLSDNVMIDAWGTSLC